MDYEILINGGIGLLGALLGGGASLLATNIQLKNQKVENDLLIEKNKEIAENIIKKFLFHEMKINVEDMKWLEEHFNHGFNSKQNGGVMPNRNFNLVEYEKVKYKLLEINSIETLKVIELYQMFQMLQMTPNAPTRKLNDFSEQEYNFIVNQYHKGKKMIEELTNDNY